MQNTQVGYGSDQRMPVVLPEMEQLLPPLSAEQFSALERDILENGCYSPIIVNEDMVIVNGHNRFRACEKHSLPFKMLIFSFEDLLEAKQWALDTQKGRRNLDKWELGKIALKLKPEIEVKARANMSAGGGDQKSEKAKSGLVNSPNLISPVDTRKEMAQAVGIGEQTMGRIAQLDENAPQVLKDALNNREVSVNRAWKILKTVQQFPTEEQDAITSEMIAAVREVNRVDAEADRKGKIAVLFCKAYEKAVLLTPTLENVRCWVEGARMRPDEIEDTMRDSYRLAQTFQTIGDILKTEMLQFH